jgi:hypothetical protein
MKILEMDQTISSWGRELVPLRIRVPLMGEQRSTRINRLEELLKNKGIAGLQQPQSD